MSLQTSTSVAGAIAELDRLFPKRAERAVSLTGHTTFRCNAKAQALFLPPDPKGLARAIRVFATQGLRYGDDWRVIGRGSNVLVRDGGFPGILVDLAEGFSEVELIREEADGAWVRADAGVPNGIFLNWLRQRHLGGFGFSYGIPGTVGGGVRMNAGTPLGSFSQVVRNVQGIRTGGEEVVFDVTESDFIYRDFCKGGNLVITGAGFYFPISSATKIQEEIGAAKAKRANQPLELPNFGSVFKNPPGDFSGRLIQEAGLKGMRIGDAQISPKHANFIVNLGSAKTSDALELMKLAQTKVKEKFGVALEPEVHVIGVEP